MDIVNVLILLCIFAVIIGCLFAFMGFIVMIMDIIFMIIKFINRRKLNKQREQDRIINILKHQ